MDFSQITPLLSQENRTYILDNIRTAAKQLASVSADAHRLELYPFTTKPTGIYFMGADTPEVMAVMLEDINGFSPANQHQILYFLAGAQWQIMAASMSAGLDSAQADGQPLNSNDMSEMLQFICKNGVSKSMYFCFENCELYTYGGEEPATAENLDFDALAVALDELKRLAEAPPISDKTRDSLTPKLID